MTLPGLQISIQKSQVGPALMKGINSLELANRLAIEQNSIRSLEQIPNNHYYLTNVASKNISFAVTSNIPTYYKFDLKTNLDVPFGNTYTSKDGITFFGPATGQRVFTIASDLSYLPPTYSGKYYKVYIDTNGAKKKPNALGRDVFLLIVDTKGSVIPYGGSEYKTYSNGSSILWEKDCNGNKINDANACAGSIADNSGQVVYKY